VIRAPRLSVKSTPPGGVSDNHQMRRGAAFLPDNPPLDADFVLSPCPRGAWLSRSTRRWYTLVLSSLPVLRLLGAPSKEANKPHLVLITYSFIMAAL